MLNFYDRKGKKISQQEHFDYFHDKNYRNVKQNFEGEHLISTIWLGIENYIMNSFDKTIFETIVFDKNGINIYQDRYKTEEEALKGHEKAVRFVKDKLKKQSSGNSG